MTAVRILAYIFLAIMVASLAVQTTTLRRIRRDDTLTRAQRSRRLALVRRALLRTLRSRVAGDLLYVTIAGVAIVATPVTALTGMVALCAIKVMWAVNSKLDERVQSAVAVEAGRETAAVLTTIGMLCAHNRRLEQRLADAHARENGSLRQTVTLMPQAVA